MLKLAKVSTLDDVEWLRVQRNAPEQYKYFRQDKPITEDEQKKWWKSLDKNRVRLFIVYDGPRKVGYVGFNPMDQYAMRAEFGIFILKEHQGKGYGWEALYRLLDYGFTEMSLRTIYSDVLDYPGEDRFGFYKAMGFEAYPPEAQTYRYKKQGEWIRSIRFFMTKEMFDGYVRKGSLGPKGPQAVDLLSKEKPVRAGVHSGKNRLAKVS